MDFRAILRNTLGTPPLILTRGRWATFKASSSRTLYKVLAKPVLLLEIRMPRTGQRSEGRGPGRSSKPVPLLEIRRPRAGRACQCGTHLRTPYLVLDLNSAAAPGFPSTEQITWLCRQGAGGRQARSLWRHCIKKKYD